MVAAWQEYDWLKQGFSLQSAGNIDSRFSEATATQKNVMKTLGADTFAWTDMRQVHGNHVQFADVQDEFPETDGLVTNKADILLAVAVADCVPLLFVDPVSRTVAVAHAGRRGTFAGIAQKTLFCMEQNGSRLEDVQVAIGPSIGPCCYTYNDNSLDLWSLNEQQLRQSGVGTVIQTAICTKHTDYFFSHQRDPEAGRFAGVIGIV